MRTIATAAAAACLLLAAPSLAASPASLSSRRFKSCRLAKNARLTSTANLRVLLFCDVVDQGPRHIVLAHVEIIGPLTGRSRARLADEGIGWGRFDNEASWRSRLSVRRVFTRRQSCPIAGRSLASKFNSTGSLSKFRS